MQVCERMMPGYGEQMRTISLRYHPSSWLADYLIGPIIFMTDRQAYEQACANCSAQ